VLLLTSTGARMDAVVKIAAAALPALASLS
jgi:hypothetical protein